MSSADSSARLLAKQNPSDVTYVSGQDPLCYPGTSILRNKLDLRTAEELEELELAMLLIRAEEALPAGQLDYEHYRNLHRHLFQDVYEWAGTIRSIRIGKQGSWFCYPEYIDAEMTRIFLNLKQKDHLVGLPPAAFAKEAAHVIAEINAVHPFREGNGRTQMTFLFILADNAGLPFDEEVLDKDRVIKVMVSSFAGNETLLEMLIADIVNA